MDRRLNILLATFVLYGAGAVPSSARAIRIPTDAEAFVRAVDARLFNLESVSELETPLEPERLQATDAVAVPRAGAFVPKQTADQFVGQSVGTTLGKPRSGSFESANLERRGRVARPATARQMIASGESRLLELMAVLGVDDPRNTALALVGALRDVINPLSLLSGMPTVGFEQGDRCCEDGAVEVAQLLKFGVNDDSRLLDFGDIDTPKLIELAAIDLSSLLDFGGFDLGGLLSFGDGPAPARLNSLDTVIGTQSNANQSPFALGAPAGQASGYSPQGAARAAQTTRGPPRAASPVAGSAEQPVARHCLCNEASCDGADEGGPITRFLRMIRRFATCLTAES